MNDGELHFFAGFVAFVTVITAVLAQTSDRKAFLGVVPARADDRTRRTGHTTARDDPV